MTESLLSKFKNKLKKIFTNLIRLCQKIANKMPDCSAKVTILQNLKKAKEKLNDVNKMTIENGEKMSQELKRDAENIENTISRTMDKYDKQAEAARNKVKYETIEREEDGTVYRHQQPAKGVKNTIKAASANYKQVKADIFVDKHLECIMDDFEDDFDEDIDDLEDFFEDIED